MENIIHLLALFHKNKNVSFFLNNLERHSNLITFHTDAMQNKSDDNPGNEITRSKKSVAIQVEKAMLENSDEHSEIKALL